MLPYLHALSATLFYVLGGSFFLAYVFLMNDIFARSAAIFLYAGQLPLLLTGLLFGGLSIYRSLHGEGNARTLLLIIGLPLLALFVFAAVLRLSPV